MLALLSQTWWMFLKPTRLSIRSVASTNRTKWHMPGRARILCLPRKSGIMPGSRVTMVARLSQFSGKRLKLQRRLCCSSNAWSPTTRESWLKRGTSILSWEEIRERGKWSRSELHSFIMKTLEVWDFLPQKKKKGILNILWYTDMENRLVVAKGERIGGRMEREVGISRCKLLYIGWINTGPTA